jgi:hypothetical protein
VSVYRIKHHESFSFCRGLHVSVAWDTIYLSVFLVHTLLMLLEKEQLLFCYAPVKAVKTSCIQLDSLLGSKL